MMRPFLRYLLSGVSIWVIVDYTTAFNPDMARWVQHMPDIWLFYLGYPLIFAYLIYVRDWKDRRLFGAMLVLAFIIEVIFSNNSLLYTFPILLVMNPVAVAIYSLVTFIPKWFTENEITRNRKAVIILVVVWVIVSILNYVTNINAS
ncbi:hypothetical protein MCGE09_00234 [Thaumarchaeota archaeon SCGC AB-539-E09]|nr:hypothetical protein MCGE09_00234 [Thaumarchaeota archaeon SCGC AB-539-E09]